ncbi:MAG: phosphate-starvation-inducible PsiE family protein [Pleurocapsa sp.]
MTTKNFLGKQLLSLFQRDNLVKNLEKIQDFIIISLCIGLFCIMIIRLGEMFLSLLKPLDFQAITADILFILILVELFRLLIIYLQEQRISVGAAVEVSLVSALREVIVVGVLEIPTAQLLSACAFLSILGGLLYLRAWMFTQFNQIDQGTISNSTIEQDTELKLPNSFPTEQYPF